MDESILISKTEKYLNEIQNEKISLEKISKLESFKSVYCKLTKRLSNLQEMREDMDLKGYTAPPYRSLNKYGSTNSGDIAFEEMSEVNRHGQYFRMKATAKKNILDRVKSAIDAHKIAIGHLEEFGIFKCESCSKSYKPSAFIELSKKESANNKNIENKENISKLEEKKEEKEECSCGCTDFKFEINKTGVYRLEIIPYLPLSGNYMVLMSEMTSWGENPLKKF
nr:DUF530 family protein [Methanobrevibacter arboriphilus]